VFGRYLDEGLAGNGSSTIVICPSCSFGRPSRMHNAHLVYLLRRRIRKRRNSFEKFREIIKSFDRFERERERERESRIDLPRYFFRERFFVKRENFIERRISSENNDARRFRRIGERWKRLSARQASSSSLVIRSKRGFTRSVRSVNL